MTDETRDYQDAVRNVARFYFDMFEREGKTAKESLAEGIPNKIPLLSPPRPPMQLVNWWEMARIEKAKR